jgi:phosphoglycolate phosphatase-like HAD superfamily hydrolase
MYVRAAFAALALFAGAAQAQDPLSAWNDGAAKSRIVAFVRAVTEAGGKDYVAPEERVVTFDNDGTLWAEQPLYFQFVFMLEQVKAAAPRHPEWKDNPAFKALTSPDPREITRVSHKPLLALVGIANSGMTVDAYDKTIRDWLASARHPKFNRPYTELVYAPMQELLAYLRANSFKTYIVSGGSIEFMRPWVEKAYGIPPEQVVGTVTKVEFEMKSGKPVLTRKAALDFVDDGPGKPVGIYRSIGRRPIAAFGNSDGDLQMLQFTAAGAGQRLMLLVHHDDAEREFAYDRKSNIGKLDKAWDEAKTRNWIVVSMKSDWKRIFAFEP